MTEQEPRLLQDLKRLTKDVRTIAMCVKFSFLYSIPWNDELKEQQEKAIKMAIKMLTKIIDEIGDE